MLKSKIKSRFNLLIIIVLFLTCIFVYFTTKIPIKETNISTQKETIEGYIQMLKIDGQRLEIRLISNEKFLIQYYIKSQTEKKRFLKYGLGDQLVVEGEVTIPKRNTNFNMFNYQNYLKSQKINYIIKATQIHFKKKNNNIFYSIKNLIIHHIQTLESRDYVYAFVMGDTRFIDSKVKDSFRISGILHLFAISGMHITLLTSFLLKLCMKWTGKRTNSYIICILFLFLYMFLTGFTPSVVRASFLFIGFFIKDFFYLNISTFSIFILIFCFLLWNNPYYIYHIGFLFSFIISFFLIIMPPRINNFTNKLSKSFYISFVAFLASIPIVFTYFFECNILTPILNVFFIPYVSIIVFPLSLLTFLCPVIEPILLFSTFILEKSSFLCASISPIFIFPYMSIFIRLVYYILLFYFIKKNSLFHLFLFATFFLICFYFSPYIRRYSVITMIDVGQGDSVLIELKNGKNILIDTGGTLSFLKEKDSSQENKKTLAAHTIIPYLKSRGIRKLDALILTHGDMDHMGESIKLIKNFKVKQIILNSGEDNILEKELMKEAKNKKISYQKVSKAKYKFGNNSFFFLNQRNTRDENEDSLIVYTKIEGSNILFMGDAENKSEKYISSVYKMPKMDILKVGHHGSKTSTGTELLQTIRPVYSMISVGDNNRYGHPNSKVLERLKENDSSYYLTSVHGMIRFIIGRKTIIHTCL